MDHPLEVEKGRHRKIHRENRICKLCPSKEVECEEHFLIKSRFFNRYKPTYGLQNITDAYDFITKTENIKLGKYIAEAFGERKKYMDWFELT